jgi:hypothetical protein
MERLTADDYMEIQQLYARYALALDTADGDGRVATFVPDGWFGPNKETMEQIRDRTNRRMKTETVPLPLGSRHLTYNLVLTATEEGADGIAFLLFLLGTFDDDTIRGQLGVYSDKLVRTPDGWRFASRDFMRGGADSPFASVTQPAPTP